MIQMDSLMLFSI